jgi:hypothetical protein
MKRLLLAILLAAAQASADDTLTATSLRGWCDSKDAVFTTFCAGYLMGVQGTLHAAVDGVTCNGEATGETLRLVYLAETAKRPKLLLEVPAWAATATMVAGGICTVQRAKGPSPIS